MTAKPKDEMTQQPIAEMVTQALAPIVDMNALFDKAIEKDRPLEVIKALNEMFIEEKKRMAEQAYTLAMAQFQKDCPIIRREQDGVHAKFAPLPDIVKVTAPILHENGLSCTFDSRVENGMLTEYCKVKHIEGHSEVSQYSTPVVAGGANMNLHHEHGSANSYAKRYAYCNALGIMTADLDDDGGLPPDPITEEQLDELINMTEAYISTFQTDAKEITKLRKVWLRGLARKAGVKGTKPEAADIPSDSFERSKEWLEAKFKRDKEQREKQ